jgi:phosphoenolpyruvate-protein phosphotransferase
MRLTGVGAVPGFATGPIWRRPADVPRAAGAGSGRGDDRSAPVDPDEVAAIAAAQLEELAEQLREVGRQDEAATLDAQARIATAPTLARAWRRRIHAGEEPLTALDDAIGAAAAALAALNDEQIAEHASDLRGVGARMRRIVTGEDLDLPGEPSIVVAEDLPSSAAAEIPPGLILGIALEAGSWTSHAAELARGLNVPCVVGVSGLLAAVDREIQLAGGAAPQLAVDGVAGVVFTQPSQAELEAMRERRSEAILQGEIASGFRDRPTATKDGHRVTLLATIGRQEEAAAALDARAEGIGLLRTEFLFTGRQTSPSEEEQLDAYRAAFDAFGPTRRVVVRLLDIGGETRLPYARQRHEANPALGHRALRLAYRDPALLTTQIRAISRAGAAAGVEPRVMASMIATRADVDLLNQLIFDAQGSLATDGLAAAEKILTGVLVDVPSGAFLTRELAPRVDFFCIDTNGLTQYLLAADRTNPDLAELRDALHPAVVRAVRMVTGAAGAAQKPVTVSGDLAGDPAGALVLVGLGVDELSAAPATLDALRYHLAGVTYEKLQVLGARALDAGDASEVRALANELVEFRPPVITPGRRGG